MRPRPSRRRLASGAPCIAGAALLARSPSPALRCGDAARGARHGRPRRRKSQKAVTRDVLDQAARRLRLRSPCRCADRRCCSSPLPPAGAGAAKSRVLRVEQLIAEAPVPSDPADPKSASLPCLSIRLGRTKTTGADEDARVFLVGRPVDALREWLARADIAKGPVFRAIDQWGGLDDKALTPQSVNAIVKRRIAFGRARPQGVFRAWAARRLSDRGGAARGIVARGDAAVAAPLGAAGGELLQ